MSTTYVLFCSEIISEKVAKLRNSYRSFEDLKCSTPKNFHRFRDTVYSMCKIMEWFPQQTLKIQENFRFLSPKKNHRAGSMTYVITRGGLY